MSIFLMGLERTVNFESFTRSVMPLFDSEMPSVSRVCVLLPTAITLFKDSVIASGGTVLNDDRLTI